MPALYWHCASAALRPPSAPEYVVDVTKTRLWPDAVGVGSAEGASDDDGEVDDEDEVLDAPHPCPPELSELWWWCS